VTHRASHPRRSGHVRMRGWGRCRVGLPGLFIGRDGHFLRAIDIQVGSDQDAIARALELREGHEVEVWERTRFVRRLSDPTSKL
jgi:hypothetical protein